MSILRLTLVVSLAVASGATGVAQTPQSWTFDIKPYGWMAGLEGQVGVKSVVTDVDLRFSDIVRHLRFGAMSSFEARKGPYVLGADVIYISLGGGTAFAVRGASGNVTLDQRETIVQPMVGYTFDRSGWSADVLLGARYWNLNTDLGLDPARVDSRSRSGTVDWLDATGGVRVRLNPLSYVHIVAEGDAGGGGSHSTWQTVGSVSYDFSKHYSAVAGYRYLDVNYDRSGFLFDTHTNGWLIGVNIRVGP